MPELLCPELDLPHPHGILDGRRLLLHGRDKTKQDGERNGDLPPNVHPAQRGNALAGRGGFDDVAPITKAGKSRRTSPTNRTTSILTIMGNWTEFWMACTNSPAANRQKNTVAVLYCRLVNNRTKGIIATAIIKAVWCIEIPR